MRQLNPHYLACLLIVLLAACGGGGGGTTSNGSSSSSASASSVSNSSNASSGNSSTNGSSSSTNSASSSAASTSTNTSSSGTSASSATSSTASSISVVGDTSLAPLAFSEQPFGNLTLIDEINTATQSPNAQSPASISSVQTILGKSARTVAVGSGARAITYRIGQGKGLVAKAAYVLEVEYPDDVPRAIFVANRGADFLRGFATGTAIGDARKAWALSTLESLNYPQTNTWKSQRTLFHLHERFSPTAQRNSICSTRPLLPSDGFDVTLFQTRYTNDPRAQGIAVGSIRLYRVNDEATLPATINYPGSDPRRYTFWREEMADEAVSNADATKRATSNAIDWYTFKMDMGRALGFNTVGKDLLEWGFNQGFDGGNNTWIYNANAPLTNIWSSIVSAAKARDLYLMPYLEYGGSLGDNCLGSSCSTTAGNYFGLGAQRRTRKLFHGVYGPSYTTNGKNAYTSVGWTEPYSADLTDPDTLTDMQRMLDKILVQYKASAASNFAGVWLRLRQTKLPISFSNETIARYNADNPSATRTLAQLQSDTASRDAYYTWWYGKRRSFMLAIRDYARSQLGNSATQVIMTAYASEPVPESFSTATDTSMLYLVTDDQSWWSSYASAQTDSWHKFHWSSLTPDTALSNRIHKNGLGKTWTPAADTYTGDWLELTHATPPADPSRYSSDNGLSMSYQFGNQFFTVNDSTLMNSYNNANGASFIHHFPLNEDNGKSYSEAYNVNNCTDANRYALTDDEPFDGLVGYVSVAVERAGPYSMLAEARALATGNPINLGYLESSSMSRGFPAYVRRFNQALLSLPAHPLNTVSGASSNSNVVVRKITASSGTYWAVINTSMTAQSGVVIDFGATSVQDRINLTQYTTRKLQFDLYPGEVRTFRTP